MQVIANELRNVRCIKGRRSATVGEHHFKLSPALHTAFSFIFLEDAFLEISSFARQARAQGHRLLSLLIGSNLIETKPSNSALKALFISC